MLSKFRGADRLAALARASALILVCWAVPWAAHGNEDGQAAFERQDFASAELLWRGEAATGSAGAMFGLGLLRDLGLGGPRDPAAAMQWYLEAANRGLAEAQFNAGVMLDSGIGLPRQPQAAATWYGRAAAKGNLRASYNLSLLLAAGDGVPKNADLARYWLEKAAPELAAAADRLLTLEPPKPEDRQIVAPTTLGGGVVIGPNPRAELVWAAPPAPEGASFHLELIARPGTDMPAQKLFSGETEASAIRVNVPHDNWQMAWRVARRDPTTGNYAAAPWQMLSQSAASPPTAVLQIRLDRSDTAAERFARQLVPVFSKAGLWVQIDRAAAPASAATSSGVDYGRPEDAGLARSIAEFMPGLAAADARAVANLALPGILVLHLAGGAAAD